MTRRPIDFEALAAAAPAESFDWTPPDKTIKRNGGELRGSSYDRRARKLWLLATFGDGERCPCEHCGTELIFETLYVDRKTPGCQGGRYTRDNIQPSCGACSHRQGGFRT